MSNRLGRAVFLDRDGTINYDVNYLSDPEDLELIPGAARAVARLNQAGFVVVVVTNQSGLARGYFKEEDLEAVRSELERRLSKEGAKVDAWYHCPHLPGGKVKAYAMECGCRKPKPGMLFTAADDLGLNLPKSFMVGDRYSDVACGRAAGVKTVLVETCNQEGPGEPLSEGPHHTAKELGRAVDWILAKSRGEEPI